MYTEKDLQKVMKGLDFVTACENISAAWEYFTSQLIEKCFHHATFINSVPATPESERHIWDNMQQILNAQVPFSEYATADDHVETTERLNDPQIVEKIKNLHQIQEEQDVGPDPDEDDDNDISATGSVTESMTAADMSEIIHTANQFCSYWHSKEHMFLEIICHPVLQYH